MEDRRGYLRGRDLLTFYLGGRIIDRGESQRLYDYDYFTAERYELTTVDETRQSGRQLFFFLYPPTMALLFAPLALLGYDSFVVLGWLWTVAGYVLTVRWLLEDLDPPREWRGAAWLAMLGFHPALVMLWTCQFSWLWLLVFVAGFRLRRRQRPWLAGLCLSLLTLKPQLAAAVLLWLFMVADWRTLRGLLVGWLIQAALVAA
jgi:hypothetical protein